MSKRKTIDEDENSQSQKDQEEKTTQSKRHRSEKDSLGESNPIQGGSLSSDVTHSFTGEHGIHSIDGQSSMDLQKSVDSSIDDRARLHSDVPSQDGVQSSLEKSVFPHRGAVSDCKRGVHSPYPQWRASPPYPHDSRESRGDTNGSGTDSGSGNGSRDDSKHGSSTATSTTNGRSSGTETTRIVSEGGIMEMGGPAIPPYHPGSVSASKILPEGGLGSISLDQKISPLSEPLLSQEIKSHTVQGVYEGLAPHCKSKFPITPLALTTNSSEIDVLEGLIEFCKNVITHCMEILNGKISVLATPDWFESQADLLAKWNAFHFTSCFYKFHGSGSSRITLNSSLPALTTYTRTLLLATERLMNKDSSWIGTDVDRKLAEEAMNKQMDHWHQLWYTGYKSGDQLIFWKQERNKMDQYLSQIVVQRKITQFTEAEFKHLETCARLTYWIDLQCHYLRTRTLDRMDFDDLAYARLAQVLDEHMSYEPSADMFMNVCNTIYEYHLPGGARYKHLQKIETLGGRATSERASNLAMIMDAVLTDDFRRTMQNNINKVDGDLKKWYTMKEHPYNELFLIRLFGDYLKERKKVEFFQYYFIGPFQFPTRYVWLDQEYRPEIGMKHKRSPLVVSLLGHWYVAFETNKFYFCKTARDVMLTWMACLWDYSNGQLEDGFTGVSKMAEFILTGKS